MYELIIVNGFLKQTHSAIILHHNIYVRIIYLYLNDTYTIHYQIGANASIKWQLTALGRFDMGAHCLYDCQLYTCTLNFIERSHAKTAPRLHFTSWSNIDIIMFSGRVWSERVDNEQKLRFSNSFELYFRVFSWWRWGNLLSDRLRPWYCTWAV